MPTAGQPAPDFELLNDEGETIRLSDYRGKKVILYFYPADFTTGCEMQACAFRDSYPDIEAKNAVVLGVSPDSVESHRRFREALHLPFNLLSDPGRKLAADWDSLTTWTNKEGVTSPTTRRSHFVIDEEGMIVDAQNPVRAPESRKLALEKL